MQQLKKMKTGNLFIYVYCGKIHRTRHVLFHHKNVRASGSVALTHSAQQPSPPLLQDVPTISNGICRHTVSGIDTHTHRHIQCVDTNTHGHIIYTTTQTRVYTQMHTDTNTNRHMIYTDAHKHRHIYI